MSNLVMSQYIEQGPRIVAHILQVIPSFNLYRGLYELSQVPALRPVLRRAALCRAVLCRQPRRLHAWLGLAAALQSCTALCGLQTLV